MFSRLSQNFRYKLTFSYVAIFLLVFSATTFFILRAIEHQVLSEIHESQVHQAKLFGEIFSPLFRQERSQKNQEWVKRLGDLVAMRITVIHSSGEVLADSDETWDSLQQMENHAARPEIRAALSRQIGSSSRFSTTINVKMLYVALPVSDRGNLLGAIRVALPLTHVQEVIRSAQHPIALGFLIGTVVVLVWGIWLGGSLTRRVRVLTDTARRFTQGDLSQRALLDSQDDFGVLAKTMNLMAASISERMHDMDAERKKLSAIVSSMSEGVLAVDLSKTLLMLNPAAEKLFKIEAAQAVGKSLIEAIRNSQIDALMTQALMDQGPKFTEIEWVQAGSRILRIQAVGISRSEGQVAGVMVLADLTDLRRLEKNRKEFLANVSHELRTPLTSIQGIIETIQEDKNISALQKDRFLKMMEEDTSRLRRLVDDLMELSRIESRSISFQSELLDMNEEIDRVIELLNSRMMERNIHLENKMSEAGSLKVFADRDRLRQILINLIDNAIKFNCESGRILIRGASDHRGTSISISDSGLGIPSDALDRVFERFYRVDKARSRELGGSGLGLAITKHLVEAQGGNIFCQSQLGHGSTFTIFLPNQAPGNPRFN